MSQADPGPETTIAQGRRFPVVSPAVVLLAGGLVLALMLAEFPLAALAHQNVGEGSGGGPIWLSAPFGVMGFLVAWRKPGNRLGWILLGLAGSSALAEDASFTWWPATGYDTAGCRSAGSHCWPSPPGPCRSC